jgi:hypothetical protein
MRRCHLDVRLTWAGRPAGEIAGRASRKSSCQILRPQVAGRPIVRRRADFVQTCGEFSPRIPARPGWAGTRGGAGTRSVRESTKTYLIRRQFTG